MNSSVYIDNKNKGIWIFGEVPTPGLDDTTLTAETKYPVNFTQPNERFVLSLHCNTNSSFSFVNATKIYQFKTKGSKIEHYALCLRNILKDFTTNNLK